MSIVHISKDPREYEPGTVGYILHFIRENNIPMDAKVCIQRIEDIYFEKHGWTTIKKEGEHYWWNKDFNNKIDSGYYNDPEEFPELAANPEMLKKITDEELESSKDEYIAVHCPVKYKNDDNLYLDAHY